MDDDHFNLPDLSGRIVVEKGTTDAFSAIGKTGGTETHQLTEDEMPNHSHLFVNKTTLTALSSSSSIISGKAIPPYQNDDYSFRASTTGIKATIGLSSEFGGDKSHNNIQPYIVQEYRIFTG